MTRWARGGNANKKKPHDASTWEQMTQQQEKQSGKFDPRRKAKQDPTHAIHKKKAKEGKKLGKSSADNGRAHFDKKQSDQNGLTCSSKNVRKLKNTVTELSSSSKSIIDVLLEADTALTRMTDKNRTEEEDVEHWSMNTPEIFAKKEKRSEERRLKRQKKKADSMVCFHCRQPGHGVADCPEVLGDVEQGTGICYRCGSTEHDVSKCNAKVDKKLGEFPYAKCFICGQTGHLSRMCPDNPRGLYPEGGGCKECGSVEHRWWNCPVRKPVKGVDVSVVSLPVRGIHTSADAEPAFISKPKVKVKKSGPKVVVF